MKFARSLIMGLALVGVATPAFADTMAKKEEKKAPAAKSLYDRLGGKDAITAVVKEFLGNVVADKRINAFFRLQSPALIARLREKFPELDEHPDPRSVFLKLRELRNSW